MSIKKCYENELRNTVQKIKKAGGNFVFAVVTDTHLDNSLPETLKNIKAADEELNFRFLAHLGDFLNGNIPKKYTEEIFAQQMKSFMNSVKSKEFYPTQGNHDGFCDLENCVNDMATDEVWYRATKFLSRYPNVHRKNIDPYYYVDFPDEKIRLVFICAFNYEYSPEGVFKKIYGIKKEQIEWLSNEALNVSNDWTVMFFSHYVPFGSFNSEGGVDDDVLEKSEELQTVLKAKEKHGFSVPIWFAGDLHGDYANKICGINCVITASETAYVPQLWKMPALGYYPKRELNTVSEDLWEAVSLNTKKRTISLIRFGAGEDRILTY